MIRKHNDRIVMMKDFDQLVQSTSAFKDTQTKAMQSVKDEVHRLVDSAESKLQSDLNQTRE